MSLTKHAEKTILKFLDVLYFYDAAGMALLNLMETGLTCFFLDAVIFAADTCILLFFCFLFSVRWMP